MSPRQLKAIFAILGLLVVVYVAVQALPRDRGAQGGDDISAAVADGFDLVRVLGPGESDSLRLESFEGTWTVNGYPADTALVRQLGEGLQTARTGRLVARSAGNHERLGVAEESTRTVRIGPSDEPDVAFFLGKGGSDGRFVRFPGSDEVFAVPTASVRLLARSLADWRSRIVATVDTSVVGRIAVRRSDQPAPLLVERVAGEPAAAWTLAGEPADTAVVRALLEESALLRATGFPSDSVAFAADFDNAVAVLEMFDSDEPGAAPALSLLFLTSPDARDFLVRRADDPLAYRISAAQAERLLPTRAMVLAGPVE